MQPDDKTKPPTTEQVQLMLANCRAGIKEDIESCLTNTFYRIGLDLKNQETLNKFNVAINNIYDVQEKKKATYTGLKSALINASVPAFVSVIVVGICEFFKR